MKKVIRLTGAALIAQAVLSAATPALAVTTITGTIPNQADLDTQCMALIASHAAPANFTARATTTSTVIDSENSSESEHQFSYDGEASYGGQALFGPYRNPGVGSGDSNIFALAMYTTQTFPTVTESWTETTVTVKHVNFGCSVYNRSGNLAGAEWQEYTGNSASWTETSVEPGIETTQGGTVTLTEPVAVDDEPLLICNKPNGVWNARNGYGGALGLCSDDLLANAEVF
ncbi:MAG: hypothetical protein WCY11_12155 [Novosphingobium sp.]